MTRGEETDTETCPSADSGSFCEAVGGEGLVGGGSITDGE